MQEKDTEELEEELATARDVRAYFAENAGELVDRTLAEHLALLLAEKKLTRSLVTERSGLDRTYVYHIFSGEKPPPSREKILALALAMALTPDEAQHLLYYARQPRLYARNIWDGIVYHALERHAGVIETNALIAELHAGALLE